MAKTYRNLWPDVVDWDALVRAWHRCRRGKRYKQPAVDFAFNWEHNLLSLQRDLTEGTYRPGKYRHFFIHDPKTRRVSAAPFRDRIVHHVVVGALEPIYEPGFIFDSYACRRGKGTHRALQRAQHFLRRFDYYLKTDVVRFFPSVDHECLMETIGRRVADHRLLELIATILASGVGIHDEGNTPVWFHGDDLLAPLRPTGLPIGNLTSQFFANVLLDPVDHLIKEELRVPGYVRYADDLVLFGPDKSTLRRWHQQLVEYFATRRLRLHRDKTQIRPAHSGLPFLGFRLSRNGRPRMLQSAIRRFNRRLRRHKRRFADGAADLQEIALSLQAWLAHIGHANAEGLRRDLWKRVRFSRNENS